MRQKYSRSSSGLSLLVSLGLVTLLAATGRVRADTIYGTEASDILNGTLGNDEIYGLGFDDQINGHEGDDTLYGGEGSDFLEGGPGRDTLVGGPGIDYYYIHDDEDTIIEEPGVSDGRYLFVDFSTLDFIRTDLTNFSLDSTKYPNVEGLTYFGTGPANLYGNEQNNYIDVGGMDLQFGVMIDGKEGDDSLNGSPFDDVIYGGPGHDSIQPNAGNDTVYAGDGPDEIIVNDPWSATPCPSASNKVYGGPGPDSISIRGVGGYVEGNEGDDRFSSECGGNTMVGGPGNDVYYIYKSDDVIIEQPGEGTWDSISVNGEITYTVPPNIEQVWGDGWSQWINGSTGDDTLVGGGGGDHLNGSSGSDTASYSGAPGGVVADIADPSVNTGDASGDTYTSIENVQGSESADTLTGDVGANVVAGGGGNDTLNGDPTSTAASLMGTISSASPGGLSAATPPNDVLTGGAGDDIINGGAGDDTAAYSGNFSDYEISYNAATQSLTVRDKRAPSVGTLRDGTDTVVGVEYLQFADGVKSTAGLNAITGDAGANKLVGTAGADTMYGLDGNDILFGYAGDDLLDGGAGADLMTGGDGNDSYVVDNAGDKIKESAKSSSGIDTVYTSLPSYRMPPNVENLVYTGSGNFSGTGSKTNNRMSGGPGNDTLDGQKGVDVLIGGPGDDTYFVDTPGDLVLEEPDSGVDSVISSTTITTLYQNVEILNLKKGNINGTGNGLDNVIVGSTSANILSGGDGADTLIGGMGNDTFYGETSSAAGDDGDTISYAGAKKGVIFSLANTVGAQNTGGAGTDRIYDVSAIENLTGTSFDDNLTGSVIGNVIHGSDGNDLIFGLSGSDTLYGDAGLDSIDCGADDDTDRVAYIQPTDSSVGGNRDQVSNFNPANDVVDLSLMDADVDTGGDQDFAFSVTTPQPHSVWYIVSGADVIVQGDVNGDASPDFEVLVKSAQILEKANFAL